MKKIFSENEREAFVKAIRSFLSTMDKAYPAAGVISIDQDSSVSLDSLFNYELMVYAAKTPILFREQLQTITLTGTAGPT